MGGRLVRGSVIGAAWPALLLLHVLLFASRVSGQDSVTAGLQTGDPDACEVFLASTGVATLGLPSTALPPGTPQWDPLSIIRAWYQQNLAGKEYVIFGNRQFPGAENAVLKTTLDDLVVQLDRTLQQNAQVCDQACQASQRAALQSLYVATNGPAWGNQVMSRIWASDVHHCCWPGVLCCSASQTIPAFELDADGNVVGVGDSRDRGFACVQRGGVVGLDVSRARFGPGTTAQPGGTIPPGVFSALKSSLEYVALQGLGLEGPVPDDIISARLLRSVFLGQNRLTGQLPDSAGQGAVLDTGDPGWGLHALLTRFDVSGNLLSGPMPNSFNFLISAVRIAAKGNAFTSLPSLIVLLPNLLSLDVDSNRLSGSFYNPPFTLDTYASAGSVGDGFRSIERIDLRGNQLGGTIPIQVAELRFRNIDLGNNLLEGSLPAAIGAAPTVRVIRVDRNRLSGSLPDPLTEWPLEEIDIGFNQGILGTFPLSLTAIETLEVIRVPSTNLFGPLPASLGRLGRLRVLDIRGTLMTHNLTDRNSRGELLPEYMRFSTADVDLVPAPLGVPGASLSICPKVEWIAARTAQDRNDTCSPEGLFGNRRSLCSGSAEATVSPLYFHFEGCFCPPGTEVRTMPFPEIERVRFNEARDAPEWGDSERFERDFVPATVPVCFPESAGGGFPTWAIVLVSCMAPALVILAALILVVGFFMRKTIARALLDYRKRQGPPSSGKDVTLVLTDVADSTNLWEEKPIEMSRANALHDAIFRKNMPHWHGYEVTTEGDAFLVAFHEPADAIGWCICVQQELQAADWPALIAPKVVPRPRRPARKTILVGQGGSSTTLTTFGMAAKSQAGDDGSRGKESRAARKMRESSPGFGASNNAPREPLQRGLQTPRSACQGESPEGTPANSARPDFDPSANTAPGEYSRSNNVSMSQSAVHDSGTGSELMDEPPDDGKRFFRGLLVRMAVATGPVERTRVHRVTRRLKYSGPCMELVTALQDEAQGGQILIDTRSREILQRGSDQHLFKQLKNTKPSKLLWSFFEHLRAGVLQLPAGPLASALTSGGKRRNRRTSAAVSRPPIAPGARVNAKGGGLYPEQSHFSISGMAPVREVVGTGNSDVRISLDLTELQKARASQPVDPVRDMGASNDVASRTASQAFVPDLNDLGDERFLANGRAVPGIIAAITGRAKKDAWSAPGQWLDVCGGTIMLLDMGVSRLKPTIKPNHVFQVLPPGLEERSRYFKPLGNILSPGFFQAPGTTHAPLVPDQSLCPHHITYSECTSGCAPEIKPLPDVTIVFCTPTKVDELFADCRGAMNSALRLYESAVRRTLPRFNGYECQELDGAFMIAFHTLADAYLWALSLQALLPSMPWPQKLLQSKWAAPMPPRTLGGSALPGGLRVKVGVCEGKPIKVTPHPGTGRADYFGPLVNRAARLCFAAARPGQIVGPIDQMSRALATLALTCDHGGNFASMERPVVPAHAAASALRPSRSRASSRADVWPDMPSLLRMHTSQDDELLAMCGPELRSAVDAQMELYTAAVASEIRQTSASAFAARQTALSQRMDLPGSSFHGSAHVPSAPGARESMCGASHREAPLRDASSSPGEKQAEAGQHVSFAGDHPPPSSIGPPRKTRSSAAQALAHRQVHSKRQRGASIDVHGSFRHRLPFAITEESNEGESGDFEPLEGAGSGPRSPLRVLVAGASEKRARRAMALSPVQKSPSRLSARQGIAARAAPSPATPTGTPKPGQSSAVEPHAPSNRDDHELVRAPVLNSVMSGSESDDEVGSVIDRRVLRRMGRVRRQVWKWGFIRRTVRVDHIGRYRLKGVQGEFELASLCQERYNYEDASTAQGAAGRKGTMLAPPLGLILAATANMPCATMIQDGRGSNGHDRESRTSDVLSDSEAEQPETPRGVDTDGIPPQDPLRSGASADSLKFVE
ncbi:unnamed protein product [Pedinophyceae sp. YPF-701]|nr:unnamed protein product [Pedinophyceae sp. YPF-701]